MTLYPMNDEARKMVYTKTPGQGKSIHACAYFDRVFKKQHAGKEHHDVCAVGFERNAKQVPRMKQIEHCYHNSGLRVHFFVPRAVSTRSDEVLRTLANKELFGNWQKVGIKVLTMWY